MDESGTLKGRVFPSSNQKQNVVSPVFFQQQSDKPSSLCVSQVEVSWSPSLSVYSPCSWWLSSASTSECSAIFVFTFPWRRLFMVDACKDYGNLSANVWFSPITPGRHIPNLPLWNMFVDIDTEMEKKKIIKLEMDKDIPYLSSKSLFGGVSKEFCQLFKYALYKRPHLSFTKKLVLKWITTESVNITLCKGWLLSLFTSWSRPFL